MLFSIQFYQCLRQQFCKTVSWSIFAFVFSHSIRKIFLRKKKKKKTTDTQYNKRVQYILYIVLVFITVFLLLNSASQEFFLESAVFFSCLKLVLLLEPLHSRTCLTVGFITDNSNKKQTNKKRKGRRKKENNTPRKCNIFMEKFD